VLQVVVCEGDRIFTRHSSNFLECVALFFDRLAPAQHHLRNVVECIAFETQGGAAQGGDPIQDYPSWNAGNSRLLAAPGREHLGLGTAATEAEGDAKTPGELFQVVQIEIDDVPAH